jgi:hypothetical protein
MAKSEPLPAGSWRFIVSGDSRNCGDVVMPAIAAHSAHFTPSVCWHLGDLRAIYKIDEDMAFEAANRGQVLACDNYERLAWSDFAANQIGPPARLPFPSAPVITRSLRPRTKTRSNASSPTGSTRLG